MSIRLVPERLFPETYPGSPIAQYPSFLGIVTVGVVAGLSLGFPYQRRIERRAEATETEIDDVIARSLGGPIVLFDVVFAALAGRRTPVPTDPLASTLNVLVQVPDGDDPRPTGPPASRPRPPLPLPDRCVSGKPRGHEPPRGR